MRASLPIEQGHVDSDGVRIAWERHGDRGPWVLLAPTWHILHARSWKMLVGHLARRFRVLVFDPRGNGASDRPETGYTVQHHAADALAVLDHHDVASATVVTASLGTNAALWVAVEHPERVERLLLVGPAVGRRMDDRSLAVIASNYEAFVRGFFARAFNEPFSLKAIEDTSGWARETTPEVLLAGWAEIDVDLVRPRLDEVACPTLIVHGTEDLIVPVDDARKLAAAIPGAQLLEVHGGGHRPDIRDPVLFNRAVDPFLGPGAASAVRTIVRSPARARRRALFVSSPIGLGHVRRDLAIARALRERVPDLDVEWLAQAPSAAVLAAAGETIHPASASLVPEVAHIESFAGEHRLPVFRAWREMDALLVANAMVFADVVCETRYDLWVGDEAWEVDHTLHEVPELKTAPYAFLTDFVGWLPLTEAEAPLTADHNGEMVAQVERHPHVRDAALFLGEPEDTVARSFGPGLPDIPAWVAEHFTFTGYVLPDGHGAVARHVGAPPQLVAAVGGTSSGATLLRRVLEAFALLRADVPDARLLAVCGPRIAPGALGAPEGVELAGYVEDLPARLAACDLAVVQGGLATTMELLAAQRPFVWVPLSDHCEQLVHVAHRLRRLGAPPPTALEQAEPEALAALVLERLGSEPRYRPIDPGGAGRVADVLAGLLGATTAVPPTTDQEVTRAVHSA